MFVFVNKNEWALYRAHSFFSHHFSSRSNNDVIDYLSLKHNVDFTRIHTNIPCFTISYMYIVINILYIYFLSIFVLFTLFKKWWFIQWNHFIILFSTRIDEIKESFHYFFFIFFTFFSVIWWKYSNTHWIFRSRHIQNFHSTFNHRIRSCYDFLSRILWIAFISFSWYPWFSHNNW